MPTELGDDHGQFRGREQIVKRHLPIALALLTLAPPLHAETAMGRLFFTPEQRAALDRARQQNISAETTNAAAPDNITLNGVVRRSDGHHTVWINSKAFGDKPSDNSVKITRDKRSGNFTLQLPYSDKQIQLKVGQSLDAASGKVDEAYRNKTPAIPQSGAENPPSEAKPDSAVSSEPASANSSPPAPKSGGRVNPAEPIGRIY